MIEECDFFQERLVVRIPKSVSPGILRLIDGYTGVVLAANMGSCAAFTVNMGALTALTLGAASASGARGIRTHQDALSGELALAHNGNLTNAVELYNELRERGISFRGTSDSEIIAALLATLVPLDPSPALLGQDRHYDDDIDRSVRVERTEVSHDISKFVRLQDGDVLL